MGSKTDESDNSSCSAPTTLQKAGRSSRGRLCQVRLSNCSLQPERVLLLKYDNQQLFFSHPVTACARVGAVDAPP